LEMWLCAGGSGRFFPARIEPERPISRRLKTAAQCTDCDAQWGE
jgi:hypothetical protein